MHALLAELHRARNDYSECFLKGLLIGASFGAVLCVVGRVFQ